MTGLLIATLLWLGACLLHQPQPRTTPASGSTSAVLHAEYRNGLKDPAIMMDLMASMLDAGASPDHGLAVLARSASPPVAAALTSVRTALDLGASWDVAWSAVPATGSGGAVAELGRALRFAGTTGAPSAALVNAHAAQFRRRRNREAERRAAALGVKLVVPLGLCSLPAFVCLGVIPILVGLFPAFD